jgi:hypothetical protein
VILYKKTPLQSVASTCVANIIRCLLQAAGDERAALALDMFVYCMRTYICIQHFAVTLCTCCANTICCLL